METVELYNKICPCGKGRITVTEKSPDHPYARIHQTVYDVKIACEKCNKLYSIGKRKKKDFEYIILKNEQNPKEIIQLCSMVKGSGGFSIV